MLLLQQHDVLTGPVWPFDLPEGLSPSVLHILLTRLHNTLQIITAVCIHWSVIADEAKLRRTVLSCMQKYGMYFLYCTQYACSMWCERVRTHTHCRLISHVDLDRCRCSDLCWDFPVRTTLVGDINLENHLE